MKKITAKSVKWFAVIYFPIIQPDEAAVLALCSGLCLTVNRAAFIVSLDCFALQSGGSSYIIKSSVGGND